MKNKDRIPSFSGRDSINKSRWLYLHNGILRGAGLRRKREKKGWHGNFYIVAGESTVSAVGEPLIVALAVLDNCGTQRLERECAPPPSNAFRLVCRSSSVEPSGKERLVIYGYVEIQVRPFPSSTNLIPGCVYGSAAPIFSHNLRSTTSVPVPPPSPYPSSLHPVISSLDYLSFLHFWITIFTPFPFFPDSTCPIHLSLASIITSCDIRLSAFLFDFLLHIPIQ